MDDSIGVKVGESLSYIMADVDLYVKWEETRRVVEKLRQVFIVHQLHEQGWNRVLCTHRGTGLYWGAIGRLGILILLEIFVRLRQIRLLVLPRRLELGGEIWLHI